MASLIEYNKYLEEVKKLYKNVDVKIENTISIGNKRRNITVGFDNDFGVDIFFGPGSYGFEKGLLELAVIYFPYGFDYRIDGELYYGLCYYNPVAEGDVRGYLTAEEALELTKQVASWDKNATFPEWE